MSRLALWRPVLTVAIVATVCAVSWAAFASDPFEHIVDKPDAIGGGIDPHGDSWQSMQHSLLQFSHFEYIARLFVSLLLAVACAWIVAWHPQSTRQKSLNDLEERKALVLLGMVGAVVSELSSINHSLALVIFGIGALLRFRTVLDNPKLTGKAIIVVVIGLACGLGSWAMAVFVTAFSWVLIYWLDSRVACRLRIRLPKDVDPEPVFGAVQSLLISRGFRMQGSTIYKAKGQLAFLMHVPASFDIAQLRSELRSAVPQAENARIDLEVA